MMVIAALALMAVPDEPNCIEPTIQLELNACAGLELQAADAAMNREWKRLLPRLKARDKDVGPPTDGGPTYVKALLDAQRTWLRYRQTHCRSYAFFARGGSMEPMQLYGCEAQLTNERTKQLHELFELYGM